MSIRCVSLEAIAKTNLPAMQRARGEIDFVVVEGSWIVISIWLSQNILQTMRGLLKGLVNTAGGLTGGDKFDLRLAAVGKTHLTVSTQTAERVYRALGSKNAEIQVDITLSDLLTCITPKQ